MPSYSSMINGLLRLFPSDRANQVYKAVQKLHPQSEALANAELTRTILDEQISGWITRHAWEACRGWHWPFWMNLQTDARSPVYVNPQFQPHLTNVSGRDAAPVLGIPGKYCGTVDRRGMVTPPHGRFSVETWFSFPDRMLVPAEVLDDSEVTIRVGTDGQTFTFATEHGSVKLHISAGGPEDAQFIRISANCKPAPGGQTCPVTVYFAIRPYTLESVVPIHDLVYNSKGFWMSDNQVIALFPSCPDVAWASDARHGDAAFFVGDPPDRTAVRCTAGLATSLSGWHIPLRDGDASAEILLPLSLISAKTFPFADLLQSRSSQRSAISHKSPAPSAVEERIRISTGTAVDDKFRLASHELRSLLDVSQQSLHERFRFKSCWLPAAAKALLYQGAPEAAARLLQLPLLDVQKNGNLTLSAGKFSLHGQVLTAAADYHRLSRSSNNQPVVPYTQLRNIARWIMRKRREIAHAPEKPKGLFPPGVTRSNTGVEYQMVDNFWGLQGLASAAWLARHLQEHRDAEVLLREVSKFASNIASAMHREVEYSISHLVPARLHRAFDASTAAELLEIALMPDAWRLLKAETWMPRLVEHLHEPLTGALSHATYTLRRIDENGVYPARRMLLGLTMLRLNDGRLAEILQEALAMQTPLHTWPECVHPHAGFGTGRDMVDIEATSLFVVLVRKMLIQDDSSSLTISSKGFHMNNQHYSITLNNAPTEHGVVSAELDVSAETADLDLKSVTADPTVEVYWHVAGENRPLGVGASAMGTHHHKLLAAINNPES